MNRKHERIRIDRRFVAPLITAALLAVLTLPQSAAAAVKVAVRVNTPSIDLILQTGGHVHGGVVIRPERRSGIRLTENDRQVAQILARRSAYRQGELLRLRQAGYNWRQIGRLLDLPVQLVDRALRVAREDDRQQRRGHGRTGLVLDPEPGCRRR